MSNVLPITSEVEYPSYGGTSSLSMSVESDKGLVPGTSKFNEEFIPLHDFSNKAKDDAAPTPSTGPPYPQHPQMSYSQQRGQPYNPPPPSYPGEQGYIHPFATKQQGKLFLIFFM